ncbi:MAG: UbiA prenyltransferase family protein [Candidatus Roizmanbacteria bacterium]
MTFKTLRLILKAARPNQWIKNLVIYTSLIFSGQLFTGDLFLKTTYGFLVFCLLSSVSYILNDIVDFPYDKKHSRKKFRPIASGQLSIQDASFFVFTASFVGLLLALMFSTPFFVISFAFLLLHFFYSLYFKQRAILDIFAISFSFMLRAFAGQVITGYHIQIWLVLSIFFISLFLATVKRHAELVTNGTEARKSLSFYNDHFLFFLTSTFATLTIITYSMYTFLESPSLNASTIFQQFSMFVPSIEARKWFMITIPIVVYGIARYAQLLYDREGGEMPEKVITRDKHLIATIVIWGIIVISLLYIF